MLVLSRREGQTVQIGQDVVVRVVKATRNGVRLAFEAPRELPVMRGELFESSDRPDVPPQPGLTQNA